MAPQTVRRSNTDYRYLSANGNCVFSATRCLNLEFLSPLLLYEMAHTCHGNIMSKPDPMSLLDEISSEDFIKALTTAPYVKCPICGEEDSAGTCVVAHHSFTRRCFKCGENSQGGQLPNLDKKIIYLDQMALGFILRALMSKEGITKEDSDQIPYIEKFLSIFEKLNVLNRKQLLVCPKSDFHIKETSLMPKKRAEALKKVSTLLSSTDSFLDIGRIIVNQLYPHFESWLQEKPYEFSFEKTNVVAASVDEWNMWINVVIKREISEDYVKSLLAEKNVNSSELTVLFKRWRSEKGQSYDNFRLSELSLFGNFLIGLPATKSYELPEVSSMIELLLRSILFADQLHSIAKALFNICEKYGVPENERGAKISEYFDSQVLSVPFFQIASALTALIAFRASQNKEMKADGNDIVDIFFLSLFLPYTDAILLEKKWHKELQSLPINFKAKIFSVSNLEDFLTYLDNAESAAPPEILEKAAEVYGEIKPYYTVHQL